MANAIRSKPPSSTIAVKYKFQTLAEAGIYRPFSSPWASLIHMVKKKDGNWQICGEYRRLNTITFPDSYPTPYLLNCTSSQDYVNRAIGDLNFAFTYINDILVAPSSREEHFEHLEMIFQRLKEFQLRLNVRKCLFLHAKTAFLEYIIKSEGIQLPNDKTESIAYFPKPKTTCGLRRFFRMVNFYRLAIPNASVSQAPLNAFLDFSKKNDKTKTFNKVKDDLLHVNIMSHLRLGAEIRIVSDASNFAMGATLGQSSSNSCQPLAFFSRK